MIEKSFPKIAKILGYAGLIPFIALALAVWIAPSPYPTILANMQVIYGGIIVSFLGAVYWGIGIENNGPDWLFVWAVAPAILAWGGLIIGLQIGYPIIILGLLVAAVIDGLTLKSGIIDKDYFIFRRNLTILAVASLAIGWAGVV